jgi:hypothetical protein
VRAMLRELKELYGVVKHNEFEKIIEHWKNRFLKFYSIICHDDQYEWEKVYRTCLLLEAIYGSDLAKSVLFYGEDSLVETRIREANAVGALLSEIAEYYVISRRMTKDELFYEIDHCLKKIKEEVGHDGDSNN